VAHQPANLQRPGTRRRRRKVGIAYPGNHRFTSFSHSNSLGAGRTDFTAIRVTPTLDCSGAAALRATIQYDNCATRSRKMSKTSTLTLPVMTGGGTHVHGIPAGNSASGNGTSGNGTSGNGAADHASAGNGSA
jgi:hypothetical protein